MAGKDLSNDGENRVFTSRLEWIAAATGLILAIGILGFIAFQAVTGSQGVPPAVSVSVTRIAHTPAGYAVELQATNHTEATAAGVTIEAELKQGGRSVEKSLATISYVPGYSKRQAGIFFKQDPRIYDLEVRALGYERP